MEAKNGFRHNPRNQIGAFRRRLLFGRRISRPRAALARWRLRSQRFRPQINDQTANTNSKRYQRVH